MTTAPTILDISWDGAGQYDTPINPGLQPFSGTDETFVIGWDRIIWHAWPGSGGWHQVSNGAADYFQYPFANGTWYVPRTVYVNASGVCWKSTETAGVWANWVPC